MIWLLVFYSSCSLFNFMYCLSSPPQPVPRREAPKLNWLNYWYESLQRLFQSTTGRYDLPYFPLSVIYYSLVFFWQFNSERYWTREEWRAGDAFAVTPQKLDARKHQRAEKKATSHQSATSQAMAPITVALAFALLLPHLTQVEFHWPFWLMCFFFSSCSIYLFPHHIRTAFFYFLFFAKEVVIPPPTQPCARHLFTPENEVCDESQLPLRKLAVDSHLISLPRVDNCSFFHHTCLCSASMGLLTRTSLIWVGGEEEHCPKSLLFVMLGRKVSWKSCRFLIWSPSHSLLWDCFLALCNTSNVPWKVWAVSVWFEFAEQWEPLPPCLFLFPLVCRVSLCLLEGSFWSGEVFLWPWC